MTETLEFPVLLRWIDDRSAAFRAAVAAAPSLEAQVPTCPEWSLLDLVAHLGNSARRWATIVAAGPVDVAPTASTTDRPALPPGREALLAWSADSTAQLLSALRAAGPDRGCWTWWGGSQSPQTCGAVARHQVQHITVHTYDAQATSATAQPLPEEAALDGVDEFLSTCCAGTDPWPHDPAVVEYRATEGRSWRLALSAGGARSTRMPAAGAVSDTDGETAHATDAAVSGTASELVLVLYGRVDVGSLSVDGDRRIFDHLLEWDPDA